MSMLNKKIDFNKSLKPVLIVYAALIIVGIIISCIFGVKLDINFTGGARISYSYTGEIDTAAVEKDITDSLGSGAAVTYSTDISGETKQIVISLSGNKGVTADTQNALTEKLQKNFKDNTIELYDSNSVSPTIAGTFFAKSLVAVAIAGILVVIYVGIRFRNIGGVSAAITAFVSLILDCVIAFLACVIFRLPVDSNLIAVILTLLGYSLNDTIVIYDRVRENNRLYPDKEIGDLVNISVNKVMIRNIVTTVTTIVAVATIVLVSELYGLTTLRTFAIPMAFGLISGSISSIFLSGPLWVIWQRHKAKKAKKARDKEKASAAAEAFRTIKIGVII